MKTVVLEHKGLHKLLTIGVLINKTTLKPLVQLSRSFDKYHFTIPKKKQINLKEYNYNIYPFELSFMDKFIEDISCYQKIYLNILKNLWKDYLNNKSDTFPRLLHVAPSKNELRKCDYAVVYHINDYSGFNVCIQLLDNVNSKMYTICGSLYNHEFIENNFKVSAPVYQLPGTGVFRELTKEQFEDIIFDTNIKEYNNLTVTMLRSICYACDLKYDFYKNDLYE